MNTVPSICTQCTTYMGSSTETVAIQVYEILKIDPEFLQFFLMVSKIQVSETPF